MSIRRCSARPFAQEIDLFPGGREERFAGDAEITLPGLGQRPAALRALNDLPSTTALDDSTGVTLNSPVFFAVSNRSMGKTISVGYLSNQSHIGLMTYLISPCSPCVESAAECYPTLRRAEKDLKPARRRVERAIRGAAGDELRGLLFRRGGAGRSSCSGRNRTAPGAHWPSSARKGTAFRPA